MSLHLDRSTWRRVCLGDVIVRSKKQVDPRDASVDRYVAGGHFDSGSPTIARWGDVNDGQMGSTFRYAFHPGQVLFISARPYLRKVGIPQFHGVVADKTYVLDAIPENGLSQQYLPFLLLSERFCDFAVAEATGSMNPRLLWGAMQRFQFDLPPLDVQERIADLLWAVERHWVALTSSIGQTALVRDRYVESVLGRPERETVSLGQAASITSGVTLGPARKAMDLSAPYLRVANVHRGRLDLDEIKTVGATHAEIQNKGLVRGDVLVVEGHASADEVGRAAMWDSDDDSLLFQNHLFRVRAGNDFRPAVLLEAINSARGRAYIRTVAKSTSGLYTINSTALKALQIPRLSLDEQDSFLRSLSRIDLSRQTIVTEQNAFRGLRRSASREVFGGAA